MANLRLWRSSPPTRTRLADKETVRLVFTEKDHSKEKKPHLKAAFGDFGSALLITIYPDTGKIVGCDVAHAAHKQKPFTSLDSIEVKDFKSEAGVLSGRICDGWEGGHLQANLGGI